MGYYGDTAVNVTELARKSTATRRKFGESREGDVGIIWAPLRAIARHARATNLGAATAALETNDRE